MDLVTILLVIIAVGVVVAIFLLLKKKPEAENKNDGSLLMLQQQIGQIAQAVDSKLSESNKNVQEQFKYSADIIRNVTEKGCGVCRPIKKFARYFKKSKTAGDSG
jgi:flagellar basal body-associated protein FliL